MIGNVQEFARDPKSSYRYPFRAGDGLAVGPASLPHTEIWDVGVRAIRGGSYADAPSRCRSSRRDFIPPVTPSGRIGLRPARDLDRP